MTSAAEWSRRVLFVGIDFQCLAAKEVGKGSGQGLAICRDVIVEKHQGQLTRFSKVGGGSIFSVRLPLLQNPE